MQRNTRMVCGLLGAAGVSAAAALAGLPTVIFSNIASSSTSDVPGMPGAKFNLGTQTQFDRPFSSPDGSLWILGAAINMPAAATEAIVVGTGTTGSGAAVVIKETDAAFFDGTQNIFAIDANMDIRNDGSYAFGVDLTPSTTTDEAVCRWTPGGGFELVAREGSVAPTGAYNYSGTMNAVNVLDDANASVVFRSTFATPGPGHGVIKAASTVAGSMVGEINVLVPCNQLVAPDQTVQNFTSDRYRTDATGANYIAHGDLNVTTTTDLFMMVNDCIVAQEGVPLPGSGFVENIGSAGFSADAGSQSISHSGGHYIFRGNNVTTLVDWVYVNGAVAAATDQPIRTGSLELYDDAPFAATFFNNTINSNGDYVIGGTTNAADAAANAVLVLNGTMLVAREGDLVDLDGDGTAEANVALHVFNNDDSFLTDDRKFYFHCDLRDPAVPATAIGQALLWIQLPPLADMNCDMTIDFFDIDPFLLALFDPPGYATAYPDCDIRNADVNKSGAVDFFDIDPFLDALFGA